MKPIPGVSSKINDPTIVEWIKEYALKELETYCEVLEG